LSPRPVSADRVAEVVDNSAAQPQIVVMSARDAVPATVWGQFENLAFSVPLVTPVHFVDGTAVTSSTVNDLFGSGAGALFSPGGGASAENTSAVQVSHVPAGVVVHDSAAPVDDVFVAQQAQVPVHPAVTQVFVAPEVSGEQLRGYLESLPGAERLGVMVSVTEDLSLDPRTVAEVIEFANELGVPVAVPVDALADEPAFGEAFGVGEN